MLRVLELTAPESQATTHPSLDIFLHFNQIYHFFFLTQHPTQTAEPKSPCLSFSALPSKTLNEFNVCARIFFSFILLFSLSRPLLLPKKKVTPAWRPQADGGPCPPPSPPVRVAAPAWIRLDAGRGSHRLASSVCTLRVTRVGTSEEGPARLFWVLLSPQLSP